MEKSLIALQVLLLVLTAGLIAFAKMKDIPSWHKRSRLDNPLLFAYIVVAIGWLFVAGATLNQSTVSGVGAFIGFAGHMVAAIYFRRIMRERVCN